MRVALRGVRGRRSRGVLRLASFFVATPPMLLPPTADWARKEVSVEYRRGTPSLRRRSESAGTSCRVGGEGRAIAADASMSRSNAEKATFDSASSYSRHHIAQPQQTVSVAVDTRHGNKTCTRTPHAVVINTERTSGVTSTPLIFLSGRCASRYSKNRRHSVTVRTSGSFSPIEIVSMRRSAPRALMCLNDAMFVASISNRTTPGSRCRI